MTDAHNPKLLSEADAAADLEGLPRPGDLPPYIYGGETSEYEKVWTEASVRTLVSERDALAGRVTELETEVDEQCRINGMGAERELALMGRVRELEAERDRLKLSRADRECLRIGQEMQRAAGELPEGFSIEVAVELGSGWVTLIDENYKTQDFNDTADGLSHCITQAIDAALSTTPESKP